MSKLKQEINKELVLKVLSSVYDTDSEADVVTAGIISSVVVKGNSVGFAIEVDINHATEKEILRKKCEAAVKTIEGVGSVTAVLTSINPGILSSGNHNNSPQGESLPTLSSNQIPGVKNLIIVASGKGGVGKSTVAVNLARALARLGASVGIADADIYGPSIPKMMGLSGKPEVDKNNRMIPKEADGVKTISVGYLVEEDNALVWRSSMALKAMTQLLRGVNWGQLDYLVVDTPPGTGDIQLSLAKSFDISGIVLVSTPQDVALIDVKKAASMFGKVNVPVLGIVENMSYFEDDSGKKHYIFGQDGVKKFAQSAGIKFLGEIPIRQDIRENADNGKAPSDNLVIDAIALKVKKQLEKSE